MYKKMAHKLLNNYKQIFNYNREEERYIIRYMYQKWLDAELPEEKVMVIYDLLTNVTGVHSEFDQVNFGFKYIEHFGISPTEIELMDVFDMYDFIEERENDLNDAWYVLIRSIQE